MCARALSPHAVLGGHVWMKGTEITFYFFLYLFAENVLKLLNVFVGKRKERTIGGFASAGEECRVDVEGRGAPSGSIPSSMKSKTKTNPTFVEKHAKGEIIRSFKGKVFIATFLFGVVAALVARRDHHHRLGRRHRRRHDRRRPRRHHRNCSRCRAPASSLSPTSSRSSSSPSSAVMSSKSDEVHKVNAPSICSLLIGFDIRCK